MSTSAKKRNAWIFAESQAKVYLSQAPAGIQAFCYIVIWISSSPAAYKPGWVWYPGCVTNSVYWQLQSYTIIENIWCLGWEMRLKSDISVQALSLWSCVCRYIKKKHVVVAVLAVFPALSIAAIKNKAIYSVFAPQPWIMASSHIGLLKYVWLRIRLTDLDLTAKSGVQLLEVNLCFGVPRG